MVSLVDANKEVALQNILTPHHPEFHRQKDLILPLNPMRRRYLA